MPVEYHNRFIDGRRLSWDVQKLRSAASSMPHITVPLADIFEFDSVYWFDDQFLPTCRAVADHARRITTADLSDPVLLSPDGHVIDGMHRVARAVLDGLDSIVSIRLKEYPEPDRVSEAG
jgi:hypothetical protein